MKNPFMHLFLLITLKNELFDRSLWYFLRICVNVRNASLSESSILVELVFFTEYDYDSFLSKIRSFDIRGLDEYFIREEIFRERLYA
jgi:hypothetical protein